MRYVRDFWHFLIGASGAITFAALSFVDPLKSLADIGINLNLQWPITADARRAIFLALSFLWMFVWYTRTRHAFEIASYQPSPDMPLHRACRWIARDSQWAAKFSPDHDDKWVSSVKDELMSKMLMGRLEFFGQRRVRGDNTQPLAHMIPAFKSEADWDASKLATAEPPTHMWSTRSGGDVYYRVMLDSAQVKAVWPKRRLWARLKRQSPIERIGDYTGLFRTQDENYKATFENLPLSVLLN